MHFPSPHHRHVLLQVSREEEEEGLQSAVHVETEAAAAPCRRYKNVVLLLVNVMAWYYSNGMNGIAMQSFAGLYRQQQQGTDFINIFALISATTAIQLGMGALLGYSISKILVYKHIWTKPSLSENNNKNKTTTTTLLLASLHGLGSICTNVGFMYGSASLIQILKLLEPFETLLWSQLLLDDESTFSPGIVGSMVLSTSAAISLVRIQSKSPHFLSVVFALASGMTLSLRNVLQRQHNNTTQQQQILHEETNNMSLVQASVVHFTKLSWDACKMTAVLAMCVNVAKWMLQRRRQVMENGATQTPFASWNMGMFVWHPLYNTFSMITLGYCSALTHSLLNAGKRVFSIIMAIVWFREPVGFATLVGLLAVGAGGCWYTLEKKRATQKHSSPSRKEPSSHFGCFKLVASFLLVVLLFQIQNNNNNNMSSLSRYIHHHHHQQQQVPAQQEEPLATTLPSTSKGGTLVKS